MAQTVASRGLMLPLPVVVLPAVFVGALDGRGMMPASPRARMWVQVCSPSPPSVAAMLWLFCVVNRDIYADE